MKKITDIELTGLQKSVLWIVALSGILIKVVFDSFFLLLEQYDSFAAISIRLLISLLTFFSLLIIFFAGFNTTLTINETGFDSYISDLLKLLS
nr:hypothetical protein [Bacteroidales bacterium]